MAKSRSDLSPFSNDDVEIIKKETPFKGYFQVDKYTLRHKTYAGGKTEVFTREIFERGHASAMIPYDPVSDRLILIEQFRPGALAAGYHPWLIEIPAGIIEEGETPKDVAVRETFEETGCSAKRVEFAFDFLTTQGGSSESIEVFCVEVDINDASISAGLEKENEDIRVFDVSYDQAMVMLDQGYIHNSCAMVSLYWFRQNRLNIRNKWCD